MLTDAEWAEVRTLLRTDVPDVKLRAAANGDDPEEAFNRLNADALQRYFEMTGFQETSVRALRHH